MSTPDANWLELCATTDVESDAPKRVEIEGLPALAIFKLDDEFFVTDDTCSHGAASLSEGFVEDGEVECPWHSGKFCIRDGKATAFPAIEPIKVYKVQLVDGYVCIKRPAAT